MATTPIGMTSRTPIGTTPPITELRQGNSKKSTRRMTAPICVEKSDADGVETSMTRSTVVTPISIALAAEVAASLRPMFFTPPSTVASLRRLGGPQSHVTGTSQRPQDARSFQTSGIRSKSPSVNGNVATSRSSKGNASACTTLDPSSPNVSNVQSPS